MSSTLAQARPTTLSTISPDLAVVCVFSLLGLTLSASVFRNDRRDDLLHRLA
jgi:hypothetical protein